MSDELKTRAGAAALDWVKPGMILGIGTGSTAEAFVKELAKQVADGLEIVGVPTSERTRDLCEQLNVPLTTLDQTPALDLTIDGADEIDPNLSLIKGGGGALLREKIVAAASASMIVIADDTKLVQHLGAFDLPVEVNLFGLASTRIAVENVASKLGLSGDLKVRTGADGSEFMTDGDHLILDASFGHIADPEALEAALNSIPGVVENGLFTGLATHAIVAGADGVRIVEPV